MTVTNQTSKNTLIGDGATSAFSYTFRIFAASDLVVTVNDLITDTTLTLTTNYTVSGVGSKTGGLVTLLGAFAPLTSLHIITIERVLPLTQDTDLRNSGAFFPETVEDALDRLLMQIMQQGSNELINIHLPSTETGTAAKTTLPSVADRLSKVFGWNAAGDIIAVATVPTSGVTATAYIETLLDDITAIAARDTLLVHVGGVLTSQSTQRDDHPVVLVGSYNNIVQQPATADFTVTGFSTFFLSNLNLRLVYMNTSAFIITLSHQDAASFASHRMILPEGLDFRLYPGQVAVLNYDVTTGRWRLNGEMNSSIFSSITQVDVNNTTVETTILPAGVGTLTLPADFFKVGRSIDIEVFGLLQVITAATHTFRVKLGSTVFLSGPLAVTTQSGDYHLRIRLTCRSVGAAGVIAASLVLTTDSTGQVSLVTNDTATTIDTTVSQVLDLTTQFSVAATNNIMRSENVSIRVAR